MSNRNWNVICSSCVLCQPVVVAKDKGSIVMQILFLCIVLHPIHGMGLKWELYFRWINKVRHLNWQSSFSKTQCFIVNCLFAGIFVGCFYCFVTFCFPAANLETNCRFWPFNFQCLHHLHNNRSFVFHHLHNNRSFVFHHLYNNRSFVFHHLYNNRSFVFHHLYNNISFVFHHSHSNRFFVLHIWIDCMALKQDLTNDRCVNIRSGIDYSEIYQCITNNTVFIGSMNWMAPEVLERPYLF